MFVLIWRQILQRLRKFLPLTNCLITPRHEGCILGDIEVETFLLLVNSLERVEDELELRQVVVEPLRTMFVATKEVL